MDQYEAMTLEALERENRRLMAEKAELLDAQRAVNAWITRRTAEAEAERKLASMSAPEKAALAQRLRAEGIGSGEQLGPPAAAS